MNTVVSSVTYAPSGTPYVKLELLDIPPDQVAMVRSGDQDGIAVILHLGDARKIGGDLIATADVSMWHTALRRHLEQDRGLTRDEANDWMAALTARVAELARETGHE